MALQKKRKLPEEPLEGVFFSPRDDTDIIFVVQEQKIYASKAVLSIWSPVFKAMFEGDFREKEAKEIELPGKEKSSFHTFIKMMHPPYQLAKEIDGVDALTLYVLAREYQIEDILALCKSRLLQRTPTLPLLEQADILQVEFLKNHCLKKTATILNVLVHTKLGIELSHRAQPLPGGFSFGAARPVTIGLKPGGWQGGSRGACEKNTTEAVLENLESVCETLQASVLSMQTKQAFYNEIVRHLMGVAVGQPLNLSQFKATHSTGADICEIFRKYADQCEPKFNVFTPHNLDLDDN